MLLFFHSLRFPFLPYVSFPGLASSLFMLATLVIYYSFMLPFFTLRFPFLPSVCLPVFASSLFLFISFLPVFVRCLPAFFFPFLISYFLSSPLLLCLPFFPSLFSSVYFGFLFTRSIVPYITLFLLSSVILLSFLCIPLYPFVFFHFSFLYLSQLSCLFLFYFFFLPRLYTISSRMLSSLPSSLPTVSASSPVSFLVLTCLSYLYCFTKNIIVSPMTRGFTFYLFMAWLSSCLY